MRTRRSLPAASQNEPAPILAPTTWQSQPRCAPAPPATTRSCRPPGDPPDPYRSGKPAKLVRLARVTWTRAVTYPSSAPFPARSPRGRPWACDACSLEPRAIAATFFTLAKGCPTFLARSDRSPSDRMASAAREERNGAQLCEFLAESRTARGGRHSKSGQHRRSDVVYPRSTRWGPMERASHCPVLRTSSR